MVHNDRQDTAGMLKVCECSVMHDWVWGDNGDLPFREMMKVAVKSSDWKILKKCSSCG